MPSERSSAFSPVGRALVRYDAENNAIVPGRRLDQQPAPQSVPQPAKADEALSAAHADSAWKLDRQRAEAEKALREALADSEARRVATEKASSDELAALKGVHAAEMARLEAVMATGRDDVVAARAEVRAKLMVRSLDNGKLQPVFIAVMMDHLRGNS